SHNRRAPTCHIGGIRPRTPTSRGAYSSGARPVPFTDRWANFVGTSGCVNLRPLPDIPAQIPFEQRAAFGRRQACLSWKLLVSVKPAGLPQTGTLSVICCVPARVFGSQVQCAVAAFGTVEPSAHPAG